jgi:hypothetical protein
LIVAKGKAPGGMSRYDMTWAILKMRGRAPLTHQYLNVLEPYDKAPVIRRIERAVVTGGATGAEFEPLAIRITGRDFVDTIILQHKHGHAVNAAGIECDGEFGFWRERDGELQAATLVRGTKLAKGDRGLTLEKAEYRGEIVSCDFDGNAIIVQPAPPDPASLAGRHIRLSNAFGSSASYHIETAEAVRDGCRIRFRIDPRVGEGFVKECKNGAVVSQVALRLSAFDYYAGKTLANEKGDVFYKLSDVANGRDCRIAATDGDHVSAERLDAQFADLDGDGLRRFAIYDYGPGDAVTMENVGVVLD